ncbi:MAG: type II secretion system F family protein [bacterium]
MPLFQYTAKDSGGRFIKGEIESPSKYEALSQLYTRGLTVIGMDAGAGMTMATLIMPKAKATKGLFLRRVSLSEKAIFCRQMSISVSSGISLRESIETIMTDQDNATFRAVLQRIVRGLDDGLPFSEAIAHENKVFDRLFAALIKSAEESGSMTETLSYLATSMEASDRLARKVRSIMAYPTFVGVFFLIVSVVMTVFVLPRFQEIFSSFGSDLPTITRVVLSVNTFIVRNTVAILGSLAAITILGTLYVKTPSGRENYDRMLLNIPFFGDCIRKMAVARFCRNLGVMLRGGVPVTTAITIAAEVLGNRAIEASLKKSYERIISGSDIASSLDQTMFPRLVVRMIGVGEASGRLPEVLEKVSEVYEDQVEGSIMVATSMFEPVIIVVFGCIILVLVLAIYLPIFTMAAHAR